MIRRFLVAILAAVSLPATADLYRCFENGNVVISDRPCHRPGLPASRADTAPIPAPSVQAPTQANTIIGRVVSIADGDTITVLDSANQQHKIRLAGIDAPEKKQPFGDRSRQHIGELVFNRAVTVQYDKQDRYGRTVGKVLVNGRDANLEQVRAGMAWWYEKYRKEQSPADQRLYSDAEQYARAQRIGLWRDVEPVAPWDWRESQRKR